MFHKYIAEYLKNIIINTINFIIKKNKYRLLQLTMKKMLKTILLLNKEEKKEAIEIENIIKNQNLLRLNYKQKIK